MSVNRDDLQDLRIAHDAVAPRRGAALWVIAAVVLVIAAAAAWALVRRRTPEVRVAAARAVAGQGRAAVLNATGYVTARRQATVSSKIAGRLVDVLVDEGMRVEKGQTLARLDAGVASSALRLAVAEETAARSQLEETRVRIEEARLDLQRSSSLAGQGVSSSSDLDRARAQYSALKARLDAQRDSLAAATRTVELRRHDVDDATITAPFAGVVISKNAQAGEMISPNSAGGGFTRTGICTIVDMDSLEIEVDVAEAYITRVQPGQPVEAILDAYPDWTIPSHVITVIPAADRQKATVRVRIGFDSKDPRILPDMGVKVSFIEAGAGGRKEQIEVPKEALRRDGDRDVILVVNGEGRIDRRAVMVGSREGDRARILSGLASGENVVIAGPPELKDGDAVRVAAETKR